MRVIWNYHACPLLSPGCEETTLEVPSVNGVTQSGFTCSQASGIMDYSYLNQAAAAAAAGFEASSCALAAGEMQCSYGDLSSCSQMSQAAYRYTAARAAGYPGNAAAAAGAAAGGTPLAAHHTAHPHAHTHHGAHSTPCSVMAARSQEVHRHAASIFPSAINLQSEWYFSLLFYKSELLFSVILSNFGLWSNS